MRRGVRRPWWLGFLGLGVAAGLLACSSGSETEQAVSTTTSAPTTTTEEPSGPPGPDEDEAAEDEAAGDAEGDGPTEGDDVTGVVVIDPGHNGANGAHPEEMNRPVDAGGFQKACNTAGATTTDGVSESRINWEVAQQLEAELTEAGVEVILTRDSDDGVGPCIDERGLTAADAEADLLISLHADGAPAELAGFHVIHPGHRPGFTDDTVEPSAELAGRVRDELVAAGLPVATYVGGNGLHQRDDIGTLNRAGVPAVMVEAGNLQNPEDAGRLTSPDGQELVVGALASAVLAQLSG